MQKLLAVILEHRFAFALVGFQTIANDVDVRVVEPVFLERATLEALDQIIHLGAAQIKDGHDIQGIPEHLSLVFVAGDAIEHEGVLLGMETASLGAAIDEIAPEVNGWLIGDQLTTAGVLEKNLADGAVGFETAKDITAGTMKEVGNIAEDFALGALARARSAEKQDGAIFHCTSLC